MTNLFLKHTKKCYGLFQPANWKDAQKNCKKWGGYLAAINDEKTQKFFEKKLNYQAWIGAAAKKVKTEYKNVDFKWLDASRWNYTNFIPDETTITEEGTRLPSLRSSSIGPEGHFLFFHPKVI